MRWWDGRQWTAHVTPLVPWLPDDLFDKEQRMSVWARRALVGWGVLVAVQAVLVVYVGRAFRNLIHHLFVTPGANSFPQNSGTFNGLNLVFDVGELVVLCLGIVFLIWQHSAATTARALGYPARTSPGFGVGSWFIPVINFWYPYMALSDCLPPGHRLHGRAIWAWLAYITAGFLVFAALVASFISVVAAIIPMLLAVAAAAIAVRTGTEMISATEEDHRLRIAAVRSGSGPGATGSTPR